MYIQIDDDNKIIGMMSSAIISDHIFEIPDDTPEEILSNIFEYRYIDGELVHNGSSNDKYLEDVKSAKLMSLSMICNRVIENGVDYKGGHYSLTPNDQINLIQLASIAKMNPSVVLPYHADNELCQMYTAQDIIELGEIAINWITFHTTYFNFMKSQIKEMTSIDDVIGFQYGMKLSQDKIEKMSEISAEVLKDPWPMTIVPDETNYNGIIPKVNIEDIRNAVQMEEIIISDNGQDELEIIDDIPMVDEYVESTDGVEA